MSVVAGDILEVTFNHPTIGSGFLFPKANTDSTLDLGGFVSDDDANGITGSGTAIRKMNNKRWMAEMEVAWDNNNAQELETVNALAAHPVEADYTITHISGTVYAGKGFPAGDVQGNLNSGTFKLKLSGGGALKKIA